MYLPGKKVALNMMEFSLHSSTNRADYLGYVHLRASSTVHQHQIASGYQEVVAMGMDGNMGAADVAGCWDLCRRND